MLATTIIQPIDMIKVRIQIGDKGGPVSSLLRLRTARTSYTLFRLPLTPPLAASQFAVGANIIKKDGFLALYKGLDAGLLRQATYTTARLGIFNNISEALKEYNGGKVRATSYGPGRRRLSTEVLQGQRACRGCHDQPCIC